MSRISCSLHRKLCAMALTVAVLCSFTAASAASQSKQYTPYAQSLADLGVFKGTGGGFDLERTPTRSEGVVMLVRLMGAEADAAAMAQSALPFTDVPDWARGYVAYAWENGLAKGTGDTTFGSDVNIDAKMFTTFLLRSLGYRDADGDFQYAQAVQFAQSIGLFDAAFAKLITNTSFLRGHMARMCYETLRFPCKGGEALLVEKLVAQGKLDKKLANAFLASVITPESIDKELTTTELAAAQRGSIVLVTCQVPGGTSQGSGVILSADGDIITNYHVVENAFKITVKFDDGTEYSGAVTIQDYNVANDLVILKIGRTGLAPVTLGDSGELQVGEKVVAIGSPYGLSNTVSEGIVSAIRQGELQTTAPISHGSSGGALFNTRGELVGITYAGVDEGQNLGFAIPVSLVKELTGKKGLSLADFVAQTAPKTQPGVSANTKYYKDAPWCPDFGALTGNTPIFAGSEDGTSLYIYETYTEEDMNRYEDLLISCGFAFSASETARAETAFSGTIIDPYVFIDSMGHAVITGYDPYDDYVIATF